MDRSGLLTFSTCLELAEPSRIGSFSIARPLAQKAKKQVDANVADSVERGCIKLGTAAGYAEIENGRADELDSATRVNVQSLFGEVPEHKAVMRKLGFEAGVMAGCSFRYVAPPAWIFCMSDVSCDYDPKPDIPKVNFLVKDLHALGLAVMEAYSEIMEGYIFERVTYQQRVFREYEDFDTAPSYFVKSPAFREEQEIRLVWIPKPDINVSTLYLEPNKQVAKLFQRL